MKKLETSIPSCLQSQHCINGFGISPGPLYTGDMEKKVAEKCRPAFNDQLPGCRNICATSRAIFIAKRDILLVLFGRNSFDAES
jgi:hypothetical protein